MTDSHISLKFRKIVVIEHLCDKAQALHTAQLSFSIDRNYSAAFLAPVLEGMEAVVGYLGRILHAPYAEHAALLMQSAERLAFKAHAAHYLISNFHISHLIQP